MSEYLSKEEIKHWRSSLEKITLEEYAARLGKKVASEKQTNDLIDIVFKGKAVVSSEPVYGSSQTERLSSIAERAFEREQQIAPTPFSIHRITVQDDVKDTEIKKEAKAKAKAKDKSAKTNKTSSTKNEKVTAKINKAVKEEQLKPVKKAAAKTVKTTVAPKKAPKSLREEVQYVFKKALTDREQKVFDHFAKNQGQIVYAKDLAKLLDLPKDYVYKYIKNLRAKIDGEKLENADKGGFILK